MHIQHDVIIHDTFPILDDEFDRIEAALPQEQLSPLFPVDELAWDDQLDNGEEMSL